MLRARLAWANRSRLMPNGYRRTGRQGGASGASSSSVRRFSNAPTVPTTARQSWSRSRSSRLGGRSRPREPFVRRPRQGRCGCSAGPSVLLRSRRQLLVVAGHGAVVVPPAHFHPDRHVTQQGVNRRGYVVVDMHALSLVHLDERVERRGRFPFEYRLLGAPGGVPPRHPASPAGYRR